jgi:hypothetical protein
VYRLRSIEEFWDHHLPLLMSLKSGYAYLAVEKDSLSIVGGVEPEWEETEVIARSLLELLELIARKDPVIERLTG